LLIATAAATIAFLIREWHQLFKEDWMKLKNLFVAAALVVLPVAAVTTASAVTIAVKVHPGHPGRHCWHNHCYRYSWHGGYYNYYWHGRYWKERWMCRHHWCYR
jgi:hypothetical protein